MVHSLLVILLPDVVRGGITPGTLLQYIPNPSTFVIRRVSGGIPPGTLLRPFANGSNFGAYHMLVNLDCSKLLCPPEEASSRLVAKRSNTGPAFDKALEVLSLTSRILSLVPCTQLSSLSLSSFFHRLSFLMLPPPFTGGTSSPRNRVLTWREIC